MFTTWHMIRALFNFSLLRMFNVSYPVSSTEVSDLKTMKGAHVANCIIDSVNRHKVERILLFGVICLSIFFDIHVFPHIFRYFPLFHSLLIFLYSPVMLTFVSSCSCMLMWGFTFSCTWYARFMAVAGPLTTGRGGAGALWRLLHDLRWCHQGSLRRFAIRNALRERDVSRVFCAFARTHLTQTDGHRQRRTRAVAGRRRPARRWLERADLDGHSQTPKVRHWRAHRSWYLDLKRARARDCDL